MEKSLDKIGIFLSGTCMVHCILAPLVIACSPFIGSVFENPIVHGLLLILVAPITFLTLLKNEIKGVQLLGIIGLLFLALGFFHEISLAGAHPLTQLSSHDEASHLMSICGGVILCLAHFLNLRARFTSSKAVCISRI